VGGGKSRWFLVVLRFQSPEVLLRGFVAYPLVIFHFFFFVLRLSLFLGTKSLMQS